MFHEGASNMYVFWHWYACILELVCMRFGTGIKVE